MKSTRFASFSLCPGRPGGAIFGCVGHDGDVLPSFLGRARRFGRRRGGENGRGEDGDLQVIKFVVSKQWQINTFKMFLGILLTDQTMNLIIRWARGLPLDGWLGKFFLGWGPGLAFP